MAKNPCGKSRKIENPYEVYKGIGPLAGWEWRVLKKYQNPENEKKNEYARWFCYVTSPMTGSMGDMGDTYVSDVINGYSMLVEIDGKPVDNPQVIPARPKPNLPF